MNNLHSLLNLLANSDIKLSVDGDALRVDAPQGKLTAELRDLLVQHKAELLALLQQHNSSTLVNDLPAIAPAPELRYEPFPLTDMQHAFWIGRSGVLELGHVSNHGYYEIEGHNLDVARLNTALQRLIARHDMLRAIVLPDGQQQILKDVPPYQLKVLNLRGQDRETVATQLEAIRQEMSHQVLPADRFPLFDFRATCLDGDKVRLHISYDLLVFDAWSLFRLFEEWFELYQNPECTLPPLELSFRDYVLAEQSLVQTQLYQRSQFFWLNRIDKLPPAPSLPLAKNPKELKQHRCQRYNARMEASDWQQLKQKATNFGLTPTGALLAAFAEILTLWSSPQFTLNLALFNRLPMHPQVNNILGDFTSVTLLAVDNSKHESFRDRALQIQKQLWQDLEHRYFSGVRVTRELTRRQGGTPNALPVIFTSTLGFAGIGQETLTFSHFGELVYGISQASQAWIDVQVWEEKDTLTFNWDVVEGLFPDGLIADMFATYSRFLQQLANSEAAWYETTRELPPHQLAQRNAINATDAPIPDVLLHELFINQVRQNPDRPAVIASQRTLSYQELCDRANHIAHQLRSSGAVPNQLIGIVMDKGWEQIVAVMGILMAGAAYVPIDPKLPAERLAYLLKNSEVKIVLTQSWLDEKLPWLEGIQRLCVDDALVHHQEVLASVQTPDDLAYVIYTSGSTGLPKGVMITHRNVANVVVYTNQRFGINASDRILALTALNHDLSVYDIFGLLSAGGALVIPDACLVKDPHHWAKLIQREQVTLWNSVPAMMEMLVNSLGDFSATLSSLRLAILGGDWLPVSLPNRLKAIVPDIKLLSIGGPTETTIWNIGYEVNAVDPSWKSIPYGQPMTNTKYYILNEALEDCPVWVPGEMYCAGVQLAKGYWKDEQKTKAHFIAHPRTGERLYRTGDLGRYLPDGNIEFLGRVDFQIKIRGYRIEAGEIEAALMQHSGVKAAVVKAVDAARLVAYVVPHTTPPTVDELSQFLSNKLPDYMIPAVFLFLDALPLSANGKIDRKALPTPDVASSTRRTYAAPQTEIEQAIATVFQEVLSLDKVGVTDNFFDLGANSLLITTIYRKLATVLPTEIQSISIIDLFNYPTIRTLAQRLNQSQKTDENERRNHASQKLIQGKNRIKQKFEKSRISK
ncbi:non-ribosomal peptide synthetase [Chroococcidiopsis sp. TS-821]|uniref:non-ribosomal peptide synthetase n=1 Tax=Chroococcidiopsis sp. TS-821 TaxID=1378066 RepID=UPI000CEDCEA7|nr:non-ribosomal peptide synthetase [Chroococcidiopsis sp. TS-821]PPS41250.1 non-ribosomal peptide synthetase [Chroococcidiopsis sp. TS-821]